MTMTMTKTMRIILFVLCTFRGADSSSTTEATTAEASSVAFCGANDTTCSGTAPDATAVAVANASATPTTPTTSTAINIDLETYKELDPDMCTCDLQSNICDINCCCDKDCTFADKMVFSGCRKEPNIYRDTSFCQFMDYIYINNTPYEWEVNQDGLFCIVKTNLPSRRDHRGQQVMLTMEDALLQKRHKHSWSDVEVERHRVTLTSTEDFIYGAHVWVVKNKAMQLFQLPDNFMTNVCLINKNMKFLQNYKSGCSQTRIDERNPQLSAESYFKDVYFLRAPKYFDVQSTGCPKNVCLEIEARICDDRYANCSNFAVDDARTRPTCRTDVDGRSCLNLVEKARYNLYHNGTRGLAKVQLLLILKNVSYDPSDDFGFAQEYEANYFWTNATTDYAASKSGNPGYLIGRPVLLGDLVSVANASNSTADAATHERIVRDRADATRNFLALPSSVNGECVFDNLTHIATEFGYNVIAKCTLRKKFDVKSANVCVDVQKEIFRHWPVSYHDENRTVGKVVGIFGNANDATPDDWRRVLSNRTPREILNATVGKFANGNATIVCDNLVTTLKIDVFHARVDFKRLRDQEKIVGATFRFGSNGSFEFAVANGEFTFEAIVREEIMFFDVTSERAVTYADPPPYQISLPHDFFYPFVKVGNEAAVKAVDVGLIAIGCCVIFGRLAGGR